MSRRRLGVIVGLALLVCACGPTPTPLPVNLPTLAPPTPTTGVVTPTPVRYAVAPDALPYLSAADRSLISAEAQIIPLTAPPAEADLGAQYDLVVALGDLPDGTRAPTPFQVDLIVNSSLPPLDDPALAEIVRRALDPQKLAAALNLPGAQAASTESSDALTLRNQLANAGYPDGFDLSLSVQDAPGADALMQLLGAIGIDARLDTSGAPSDLTLTSEPSSAANAIELYTIPISYRAVEGLSITFAPSGFPIARRSP